VTAARALAPVDATAAAGVVVEAADGTRARRVGEGDAAGIVLEAPDGTVLLSYDPREGRLRLEVARGDLELCARDGRVLLSGSQGVVIDGGDSVAVTARRSVTLKTEPEKVPGVETGRAEVTLLRDELRLGAKTFGLQALRAAITSDELAFAARSLRTVAKVALQSVGVLETRAERVVERAKNVYRDVEELAQTRAGRVRLIARETLHAAGRRAVLRGDEDVKIKGEKIHLG
jgi:hypothetical protein